MSDPSALRVVSGSPTDEETAAIAALFSTLVLEQAVSTAPLPAAPGGTEWDRTRRALRQPWPTRHDWRDR